MSAGRRHDFRVFKESGIHIREEKKKNRRISGFRVKVENVIGMLKRFHIISHRYTNRRKHFGLRFNLIAAIYNF
ncbi:MAG: hypothetical protein LBF23_02295 [Endomicrobium sp.]|jgi:hypothetical protein|nr:hypothetical protein [Endomicrobium sp.]